MRTTHTNWMNVALWTTQVLLAALFLFAGGVKLAMPAEALAQQAQMSGPFLHFIGVLEVLGALGLLLPGLTGIRPRLMPLAAAGLVILMIGATVISAATHGAAAGIMPLITGCALAFVARRRWRTASRPSRPLSSDASAFSRTSPRARA